MSETVPHVEARDTLAPGRSTSCAQNRLEPRGEGSSQDGRVPRPESCGGVPPGSRPKQGGPQIKLTPDLAAKAVGLVRQGTPFRLAAKAIGYSHRGFQLRRMADPVFGAAVLRAKAEYRAELVEERKRRRREARRKGTPRGPVAKRPLSLEEQQVVLDAIRAGCTISESVDRLSRRTEYDVRRARNEIPGFEQEFLAAQQAGLAARRERNRPLCDREQALEYRRRTDTVLALMRNDPSITPELALIAVVWPEFLKQEAA